MGNQARTDKKDRFVDEYLIDLNATQAYLRSNPGVTEKTAATEGSRLLGTPEVQEKISAAKADRSRRTRVTQDRVLRELAHIAFLDIRKAFDPKGGLLPVVEMPNGIARAMKAFEVEKITSEGFPIGTMTKVKFEGKTRALEILLEHVKHENKEAGKSQPLSFSDLARKAQAAKLARGAKK